jgi:hypothetical protein
MAVIIKLLIATINLIIINLVKITIKHLIINSIKYIDIASDSAKSIKLLIKPI